MHTYISTYIYLTGHCCPWRCYNRYHWGTRGSRDARWATPPKHPYLSCQTEGRVPPNTPILAAKQKGESSPILELFSRISGA